MLEMNARSLQQKLETERELKQRLMEEVKHTCGANSLELALTLSLPALLKTSQASASMMVFTAKFDGRQNILYMNI